MTKNDYFPDWTKIPIHYKWLAVDSDGEAFAYRTMPICLVYPRVWHCRSNGLYLEKIGWPADGAWKEMLYERPK